ncbi:hypothetical protein [Archangium violaceum]|nr:hypothetical protein [Archangium violaceum]
MALLGLNTTRPGVALALGQPCNVRIIGEVIGHPARWEEASA